MYACGIVLYNATTVWSAIMFPVEPVGDTVGVTLGVGVFVGVAVTVGVIDDVGVGDNPGVVDVETDGVTVGVLVGVILGVRLNDGVTDGVGVMLTLTLGDGVPPVICDDVVVT